MKTKNLLIAIFSILIISLIIYLALPKQIEKKPCVYDDISGCNYSCKTDDDCSQKNCRCMNKDETIYVPKNIVINALCIESSCKCINNVCRKS